MSYEFLGVKVLKRSLSSSLVVAVIGAAGSYAFIYNGKHHTSSTVQGTLLCTSPPRTKPAISSRERVGGQRPDSKAAGWCISAR